MLTPLSPLRPRPAAAPTQPGMTALLRHRLTDQLAGRRFVAVLSLPGYGRTTLLAQAARDAGCAVSWYRPCAAAEPADHRRGLVQALLDRPPGAAELAGDDAVLAALHAASDTERLVLVDDVHLLDWESRVLLLRVGQHGPEQPRLLVAGEPADGVDTASFEAAGAAVLGTGQLRFRSFEVERLFRVCFGAPLPPDAVLPLAAYTRGQAAALHRLAGSGGAAAQAMAVPRPATMPGPAAARVLGGYLGGAPQRTFGMATGRLPAGGDVQVGYAAALGRLWRAMVRSGPGGAVPIAEAHRLAFQAELDREDWASRAARCLLGLGRHPEDVEQLPAVQWECARLGDQVTGAFAALAAAIGSVRAGRPSTAVLEDAVTSARSVGWTRAEAWSRAALALVEVTLDVPDAAERAGQAEAFARVAGMPGAQAIAISAVARAAGRADLQEAAWSIAESTGLDTQVLRSWIGALSHGGTAEPGREADAGSGTGGDTGGPRAEAGGDGPRGGNDAEPRTEGDGAGSRGAGDAVAAVPVPRSGSAPVPAAAPGAAAAVAIRCLGGFSFQVGGVEPDWSRLRPGSLALLRALATHAGEPVHRTQLIEWFWPELSPARALHNLQVSVSRLRTFLEPGLPRGQARLIARRGEAYHLVLPPGSRSDVLRFEQAVRDGRLARTLGRRDEAAAWFRQALEEYAGELLPEGGSAEWLLRDRDRLRLVAAEAAATLAGLELELDRPAAAAEAGRRAVELDSYSDRGWQALIAGLERSGRTAAAGIAKQRYAEVLAALGFSPDSGIRSTA